MSEQSTSQLPTWKRRALIVTLTLLVLGFFAFGACAFKMNQNLNKHFEEARTVASPPIEQAD